MFRQARKWVKKHRWLTVVILSAVALTMFALCVHEYGQICHKDEYTGAKDCASYNIVLVALWHIVKAANDFGAAITAVGTLAIAAFTFTLWRVGSGQLNEIREQIVLSRQEFLATHRPKLSIRHIRPRLQHGLPISITCVATNIGDTNARIEGHEISVAAIGMGADRQGNVSLETSDLAGGQSELFTTERPTPFVFDRSWNVSDPNQYRLLIQGTFTYLDDNNVTRRMGFSRRYNPHSRRFDIVIEGEDEYQD